MKTLFKDLAIGQSFDWVDDEMRMYNSFYDTCEKTSLQKYKSLHTGLEYRVGSINAKVFHTD